MMQKEMTKSLPVSKRMVWNSYLKVTSNQGGARIDDQSIEGFNEGKAFEIINSRYSLAPANKKIT